MAGLEPDERYLRSCYSAIGDKHGIRLVPKVRFPNRRAAKRHAKRWPGQVAYKCEICHCWHLGHSDGLLMRQASDATLESKATL